MDAEHPPDVTPLSFFFPEVTDEEATYIDGGTVAIMERRSKVMARYRRGGTIRGIAEELKCSIGTVHHDIHTVLQGYRRIAQRTAAEHVADQLQRLAAREADIEGEWEKSKGEQVETMSGKGKGSKDVPAADEVKTKKKQRYGDPRLAALLIGIWDRRCKLLGLMRPEDFKGDSEAQEISDVVVVYHQPAAPVGPAAGGSGASPDEIPQVPA